MEPGFATNFRLGGDTHRETLATLNTSVRNRFRHESDILGERIHCTGSPAPEEPTPLPAPPVA